MSTGIGNKYGRIFFIKIVSHNFPDKEAHTCIIYEYILELDIKQSNNMEAFQRELSRQIKQYEASNGNEWKNITYHIINQYQKIDEPIFQTGFNIRVIDGPKQKSKFAWLCKLLKWTNNTRHDLVMQSIAPTGNNQQQRVQHNADA
jgi:hypothetical protein